jgi:hypothetical protein
MSLRIENIPEGSNQSTEIDPRVLLNDKQLATTQNWTDEEKLVSVLMGNCEDNVGPTVDMWIRPNRRPILVVKDGNHRIAVAYHKHEIIEVYIDQTIRDNHYPLQLFGFNKITREIKARMKYISFNDI